MTLYTQKHPRRKKNTWCLYKIKTNIKRYKNKGLCEDKEIRTCVEKQHYYFPHLLMFKLIFKAKYRRNTICSPKSYHMLLYRMVFFLPELFNNNIQQNFTEYLL